MKFSREEKEKAEEYFNDVPWWLTEVSSEEEGVSGGVWGLSSKNEILPALLLGSLPVLAGALIAYLLLGIWAGVVVLIGLPLVMILWPLRKHKGGHKYEVKKEYTFTDNYTRPVQDRVEFITTMNTVGLLNTITVVKKYKPLKLHNHMNSFNKLAEVGEER